MTEYNTFDDYVKNVFNIEPSELTHISPQEQKNKTIEITVDELINIWNELTELKLKVDKSKWHYVKDGDLPKENQEVLIFFPLPDKSRNVVAISQFKDNDFDVADLEDVIAWKEIVFPEKGE